jgi:alkylation response protein AidB-like acyl-CoA dehydrogenase
VTRSGTDVGQVRLAAAELATKLRGRGAEIEQAGTLPADVVASLHECGIFRLWMPVELGGFEAEPADVLAIVQTLAGRWRGRASIQNRPEGGMRAELRLPRG